MPPDDHRGCRVGRPRRSISRSRSRLTAGRQPYVVPRLPGELTALIFASVVTFARLGAPVVRLAEREIDEPVEQSPGLGLLSAVTLSGGLAGGTSMLAIADQDTPASRAAATASATRRSVAARSVTASRMACSGAAGTSRWTSCISGWARGTSPVGSTWPLRRVTAARRPRCQRRMLRRAFSCTLGGTSHAERPD